MEKKLIRPWWLSKNPKNDKLRRNILLGASGTLFLLAMAGLFRGLASGTELEFRITPNPAHPGDLVIFEVMGTLPASPRIGWLENQHVSLFWDDERVIGLAAIPLDQKPGKIEAVVGVYAEGSKWLINLKKELEIKTINWPEHRVPDYPKLGPEKLKRLAKEKRLIKKAFNASASTRLWQNQFMAPLPELVETSPFGQKRTNSTKTRQHRGTDFRAQKGASVKAMNDGRVVLTGNYLFDGGIVIIDHGLGLQTLYLHMSRVLVKKDQYIKQGQIIGYAGDSGIAYGSHLHLEVRLNGEPVNPLQILEILK